MADHRWCELIVDSVQLETSPSVLSSVETVASLVLLLLSDSRRSRQSEQVDRSLPAISHTVCTQATNLNVFLCCENSGR